jgi:hypothetical protein
MLTGCVFSGGKATPDLPGTAAVFEGVDGEDVGVCAKAPTALNANTMRKKNEFFMRAGLVRNALKKETLPTSLFRN